MARKAIGQVLLTSIFPKFSSFRVVERHAARLEILKLSQKCNVMGCLTCYINGSGLSIFVFLDLKNASP